MLILLYKYHLFYQRFHNIFNIRYIFILKYLFISMDDKIKKKNLKISEKHHELLKEYCEKNGLKVYRIVEKWIDENLYGGNMEDIIKFEEYLEYVYMNIYGVYEEKDKFPRLGKKKSRLIPTI